MSALLHIPEIVERIAHQAARFGKPVPSYQRVYHALLEGVVPTCKVGRRRAVEDQFIPVLAAHLGVGSAPPVSARRRKRTAA